MIGKFDFRRDTLIWLLVVAFLMGGGIRIVQHLSHREIRYPLRVVRNDEDIRAIKHVADSILAIRAIEAAKPININTASVAQFETLDGIGPVLAQRIVTYRTEHGTFRSVDELDSVSGIGPKRLAAMLPRCTVDSL